MGSALAAGVSGLKVHQAMLDTAGNNLANINTVGYKQSTVTFSELLSQTIKKASGPSGNVGGTNPQQMGSGVGIAAVKRNMSQGNMIATGQDLDAAIDGDGYFVLNDGVQSIYTRVGSFAVDPDNTLVDLATGYRVQRMGTYGESEGFQIANNTSIHIPWGAAMPARATSTVVLNGNLRTDGGVATKQQITGNTAFTYDNGGKVATSSTYISDLDQWDTPLGAGDTGTILVNGTKEDGTVFTNRAITWTGAPGGSGDTMETILGQITALFDNSTATLNTSGKITISGNQAGYSLAQITSMTYVPSGSEDLTTPTFFDLTTVGGNDSKAFNIMIYDSVGSQHALTGVFVKTDEANTWDLVIPSISGESDISWQGYNINLENFNRRISGIQFDIDSSYKGLANPAESLDIGVQFANNPLETQTIRFDLGTPGKLTGLTQFAVDSSSAGALTQDGYKAGTLSSVSIDKAGMVIGRFSNEVNVTVAALRLASFQNPGGLESAGGGYFLPSANSGEALDTQAGAGGAGTIIGQNLESSNVDIATEFVTMMQAQNGYQANARTIRVANDILNELTNLIR